MAENPYCEVHIGITGAISAELLQPDPQRRRSPGSCSNIWSLQEALSRLAEGGYIIDLRLLELHPLIDTWVFAAPLPNGHIEGTEIDRLPESVRASAREMMAGLE